MCEYLYRLWTAPHHRGDGPWWQEGMVVGRIWEDGGPPGGWGRKENPASPLWDGVHGIMRHPGIPASRMQYLLDEHLGPRPPGAEPISGDPLPIPLLHRRKWQCVVPDLSVVDRSFLYPNAGLSITDRELLFADIRAGKERAPISRVLETLDVQVKEVLWENYRGALKDLSTNTRRTGRL